MSANGKFDPMGHEVPWQDLATLKRLVRICAAKKVVEIGSWAGQTTLALAQPGVTVHAVDHWQWNTNPLDPSSAHYQSPATIARAYDTFKANMGSRIGKTVIPHVGASLDVLATWNEYADLVFIDAGHDYDSVVEDLNWIRWVRPGGILSGHDYLFIEGVRKAVGEHAAPVNVDGNIWWKRIK